MSVNSIPSSLNVQSHISFPAKVKTAIINACTLASLPNESKVLYVIRKTIGAVGALGLGIGVVWIGAFTLTGLTVGFITAIPLLIVGGVLAIAGTNGKVQAYKIGSHAKPLDQNELVKHLQALANSKREVGVLEIIHGGQELFEMPSNFVSHLKEIQKIDSVILRNCNLSVDLQEKLSAENFWVIPQKNNGQVTGYKILPKKEISEYSILVDSQEDLNQQLKKLTPVGNAVKINGLIIISKVDKLEIPDGLAHDLKATKAKMIGFRNFKIPTGDTCANLVNQLGQTIYFNPQPISEEGQKKLMESAKKSFDIVTEVIKEQN